MVEGQKPEPINLKFMEHPREKKIYAMFSALGHFCVPRKPFYHVRLIFSVYLFHILNKGNGNQ